MRDLETRNAGRIAVIIRENRHDVVVEQCHMIHGGRGGGASSLGSNGGNADRGNMNRDSDIYGNLVRDVWDDGLEIEGANMNVRIWGSPPVGAAWRYGPRNAEEFAGDAWPSGSGTIV